MLREFLNEKGGNSYEKFIGKIYVEYIDRYDFSIFFFSVFSLENINSKRISYLPKNKHSYIRVILFWSCTHFPLGPNIH
jgi:hypothetical protein